ncbi:MIP family channel protein [Candidatus Micrarchaeota archaeon]|nr:MIP family channel protein [Candidatus Micrarchaeota archaeon]
MKKYLAEFIGTFALVFVATGTIVLNAQTSALGLLGIAIATGFILSVMIYSLGRISGAHFNPAVSIALWLGKKLESKHLLPYLIAQLFGAVVASFLVLTAIGSQASLGATIPNTSIEQALLLEAIATFFLVFVITAVTDSKNGTPFFGWAIGTTVTLGILTIGPITGASLNPARSFGPALFSGVFASHWIYWVAPIIGGIIGVFAYKLVNENT